MSDKPRDRLNELDRLLRQAKPVVGFTSDHVQLTIEKVCGFELFNTRPYHNYETWSDGYRISDGEVRVQAEDLDDAVRLYAEVVAMAPEDRPAWHTVKPVAVAETSNRPQQEDR